MRALHFGKRVKPHGAVANFFGGTDQFLREHHSKASAAIFGQHIEPLHFADLISEIAQCAAPAGFFSDEGQQQDACRRRVSPGQIANFAGEVLKCEIDRQAGSIGGEERSSDIEVPGSFGADNPEGHNDIFLPASRAEKQFTLKIERSGKPHWPRAANPGALC